MVASTTARALPIAMEDRVALAPAGPGVHVGLRSMRFFHGNQKGQAREGLLLAADFDRDVVVARGVAPDDLGYGTARAGGVRLVDQVGEDRGECLSRVLLADREALDAVRAAMPPGARVRNFFPTPLEERLADALDVPLHGPPALSARSGTRSGVRNLARESAGPVAVAR